MIGVSISAALPPFPAGLTTAVHDTALVEALRAWGHRIGLAAHDALSAADEIETGVGDRGRQVEAISDHFGLVRGHHCFNVEALEWFRMSETQATKGLRHFLAQDKERIQLFLHALAPTIAWPAAFEALTVDAEIRAGRGRIDLIVRGEAQGRSWGAVIEAKFEHSLKGNPLSEYRRHAAKLKMMPVGDGPEGRTAALIVLGKRITPQTRKRMSRNAQWRFVHWREVLRRFEMGLTEPAADEDFRRFRRTLWERTGSEA